MNIDLPHKSRPILAAFIVVLAAMCLGFAFKYPIGVFPDEAAHYGYVLDAARQWIPDYATGVRAHSDLPNYLPHPPLYYSLAGAIVRVTGAADVYFVRITNIVISIATLFVTFLMMRDQRLGPVSVAFGLALLLNVPMFVLTSSSVSNDPLSFLGCALAALGICRWHGKGEHAVYLIVVGGVIAALTKATAALGILCMVASYVAFNVGDLRRRLGWVTPMEWAACGAGSLVVAAWFAYAHATYGVFFPSPGMGPDGVFGIAHPDAVRWSIVEHLQHFWNSNLNTTLRPYGHAPISDAGLRLKLWRILLAISPVLGLIAIWAGRLNGNWRLLLSFTLAFVIFMILFFAEIRGMHLRTGYPGAMQARYWFGFLPVSAMTAAIGLGQLPRLLQYALTGLALVTLASFCYAIYALPA